MLLASASRGLLLSSSILLRQAKPAPSALLSVRCLASSSSSVSGTVYTAGEAAPKITLFTKAGCTLCDVAKDVLAAAAQAS